MLVGQTLSCVGIRTWERWEGRWRGRQADNQRRNRDTTRMILEIIAQVERGRGEEKEEDEGRSQWQHKRAENIKRLWKGDKEVMEGRVNEKCQIHSPSSPLFFSVRISFYFIFVISLFHLKVPRSSFPGVQSAGLEDNTGARLSPCKMQVNATWAFVKVGTRVLRHTLLKKYLRIQGYGWWQWLFYF